MYNKSVSNAGTFLVDYTFFQHLNNALNEKFVSRNMIITVWWSNSGVTHHSCVLNKRAIQNMCFCGEILKATT